MFVYNIYVKVDKHIEKEWLAWQQQEHMPEIMGTGLFYECRLFKLLDHDDEESSTYIIQYNTDSKNNYEEYVALYVKNFQQKAFKKWGTSFIDFRTVMQRIN